MEQGSAPPELVQGGTRLFLVKVLNAARVLPFENLTRNTSDDWLAAAFSDSLAPEDMPAQPERR